MRKTVVAILKKLLHTVILLLVLSFVVFSFIRLIPGDPVKISMGPMTPEETIAQKRSELYFDRALPIQWAHWLKGVITEGDFGESLFTHRNVAEDIKQYLPKSLELVFYCAILILIVGVAVGTISAIFKNSWLDNLIRFISYLGVCTPAYAIGVLLLLVFSYTLGIFPIGGMPTIPDNYVRTGMMGLDCLLVGDFALYSQVLKCMVLPCLSLSLGSIAYMARIHRGAMVENINADYIAFAQVAGVSRGKLVMKHLMKPSFIPTLTIYGLQVASLIGNAFIIEVIFRYPGFSQYSLNVIQNKDPYGIVAVTFVFGIIFAVVNALVDIGVAFLDPRIRINTSE